MKQQRDKLYAAEIDTTAYSLLFAARSEKELEDAVTQYIQWEMLNCLNWVDQEPDAWDDFEARKQRIVDACQTGDIIACSEVIAENYDLFRITWHIVHLPAPTDILWMVRNFDYRDRAVNEYLPNPIWCTASAGIAQMEQMNTNRSFSKLPAIIVEEGMILTFELLDGEPFVNRI